MSAGFGPLAAALTVTPARFKASMKAVLAKADGSAIGEMLRLGGLPAAISPLTLTTPGRTVSTVIGLASPGTVVTVPSTVMAAVLGRQSIVAGSPAPVAVVMMSMTFSFTQIGETSPAFQRL